MIRNPDDKIVEVLSNLFGPAVRIIEGGKKSSPIRSHAYFPKWKSAFTRHSRTVFNSKYSRTGNGAASRPQNDLPYTGNSQNAISD